MLKEKDNEMLEIIQELLNQVLQQPRSDDDSDYSTSLPPLEFDSYEHGLDQNKMNTFDIVEKVSSSTLNDLPEIEEKKGHAQSPRVTEGNYLSVR
jgi:hypothetical protein